MPSKQSQNNALVVGKGKDMQFNPRLWEQWNSDACDADDWKHGRVSKSYRDGIELKDGRTGYDNIQWE